METQSPEQVVFKKEPLTPKERRDIISNHMRELAERSHAVTKARHGREFYVQNARKRWANHTKKEKTPKTEVYKLI